MGRPRRLEIASGLVPVNVEADDLRAEIEARQDRALQEALDKARDKAGGSDFEIQHIHLGDPFTVQGRHYVAASLSIAVEVDEEGENR